MPDPMEELVTHNPMLIEITRFRRRYFSYRGNAMNGVVLSLALLCYATLVLIVAQNEMSIPPITLVMLEVGLLTIFAPMTLYGAVAGERERRSWDLLLVAPISKAQIVVGKFIGAMTALGIAVVLFQLPIMIAALSYKDNSWPELFCAELLGISFLMSVCAFTILMSARVKRGLMALGAVLGTLIFLLIVFPAFVGMGGGGGGSSQGLNDLTFFFHPFYVLGRVMESAQVAAEHARTHSMVYSGDYLSPAWYGWPQIIVYFAFTAILLTWATKTLTFAENEVKFLPQGHKDA